jgi:phosphoglycolate phosphatase/pyrophosphatase PpaX
MKLECVIFDIDGTMADTLDLCVMAFQESFKKELGKSYDKAEIFQHFNVAEGGIVAKFASREQYPQTLETYYRELEILHHQKDVVMPGIRELLHDLQSRNIFMAVVTGKGKRSAELTLREMGLLKYFSIIESGSDNAPDKTIGLGRILNQMQIDPKQAVYVGDIESDIQSALRVGMWAAGAVWAPTATLHKNGWGEKVALFHSVSDFHHWLLDRI